jgi:hypothetical protein
LEKKENKDLSAMKNEKAVRDLVKLARELLAENITSIQSVRELVKDCLPDLKSLKGFFSKAFKNMLLEKELKELESLLDGSWKTRDALRDFHLSQLQEAIDWSKGLDNKTQLLASLKKIFDALEKTPIFKKKPASEFIYHPEHKHQEWEEYGDAVGIKPRFREKTKETEVPKSMDELRKTLPKRVMDYLDKQTCPYHKESGHASCIMADAFEGDGDPVLLQVMRTNRKEFFNKEKETTYTVINASQFPDKVLVGFGAETPKPDTGEGYWESDKDEHFGW